MKKTWTPPPKCQVCNQYIKSTRGPARLKTRKYCSHACSLKALHAAPQTAS